MVSGGSAANTIHGLAHLGMKTSFIGKVGKDTLGDFYQKDMEDAGIVPLLIRDQEETGRAHSFISPDAERTFGTFLGAASQLKEKDLKTAFFKNHSLLYLEGYLVQNQDLIMQAAMMARRFGLKVALDMASYNVVDANRDFLRYMVKTFVDIIFANEEESKSLTGKDPSGSLEEMARYCEIAIVKLGEKGSLVARGREIHEIKAVAANVKDTTGAGDLYAAGFLYGYLNDLPLGRCGDIGSHIAALVTSVIGPKLNDSQWKIAREELKIK
jgi:sugar/nucleoside kinase (ribokinase family)